MRFRVLDLIAVAGLRVAALLAAPLLLLLARTRRGWLVGFAVAVVPLPLLWILVTSAVLSSGPIMNLAVASILFSGFWFSVLVLFVTWPVVLLVPPNYQTDPVPGVSSTFLGPGRLRRWKLVLPPEDDALWLGAWLVSRLDLRLSRAEARRLRDGVHDLQEEMAEYPEYRLLAPALGLALWGKTFRPDHGHFFAYVPDHDPGERLGLLVALHGHGGNSRLWLHVWRTFATENRCVVVCPSFGYGNWEHPDSPAAVERCLGHVLAHYPVDPARVVLAGISQGGAGVGRAAAAMPTQFAGLAYLSPTMEPDVLGSPDFVSGWRGRPVFVAHGGQDRHVKPAGVAAAIERLKCNGAEVTTHLDPDANHFLFFDRKADLHRAMSEWQAGIIAPQLLPALRVTEG